MGDRGFSSYDVEFTFLLRKSECLGNGKDLLVDLWWSRQTSSKRDESLGLLEFLERVCVLRKTESLFSKSLERIISERFFLQLFSFL